MEKEDLIFQTFYNTVSKKHLLDNADTVIVALSGGSDSVSLLLLLKRLSLELNSFDLCALHFNHEIRGKEADEDEVFCTEICERLNVPLYTRRGNVPKYSEENKISLEEAARILRYEALNKLADGFCKKGKKPKIAVAHNKDDKAETVFFNILRGTSVDGLRGIRYENDRIIRPILDISKDDTYEVCRKYGFLYRTDSTNLVSDCTRNKIRLEILPGLTNEMGMDISSKLLSLSSLAEKDSDYLSMVAKEEYGKSLVPGTVSTLDIEKIRKLHEAIFGRVIVEVLKNAKSGDEVPYKGGNGISNVLVNRVTDFILGDDSGTIELGKNLFLTKKDGKAIFGEPEIQREKSPKIEEQEVLLKDFPFMVSVTNGKESFKYLFEREEGENLGEIVKNNKDNKNTVFLDSESVKSKLTLRGPKEDDKFYPFGCVGGKKLSRYLIDKKIPQCERPGLVLLCDGDTIVHIFGVGRSKYYALSDKTANLIKITKSKE